jgi:hypothetical protein
MKEATMTKLMTVLVSVLLIALVAAHAETQVIDPGCGFTDQLGSGDIHGNIYALEVYDDGSGPALYAAGGFTLASGNTVNGIARWSGSAWEPLAGTGEIGVDATIITLAVYDDGGGAALYAGGGFISAGGIAVNHIARWDGSSWSALAGPSGTGTDKSVHTLFVHDDGSGPALYVGGDFTTAGGITVNHIARWDGSTWSALSGASGVGTDDSVYALAAYDDGGGTALFLGGAFTTAAAVTVNYIASWDGSDFSPLVDTQTGTTGEVYSLATCDTGGGAILYVGGFFQWHAKSVTFSHIAGWNGSTWSNLPGGYLDGVAGWAYALAAASWNGSQLLQVGGRFEHAGDLDTPGHHCQWNGTAWVCDNSQVAWGDGLSRLKAVHAMVLFDNGSGEVIAIAGALDDGESHSSVVLWDGAQYQDLDPASPAPNDTVRALTVLDDGTGQALYAGGELSTAGRTVTSHVARWDGSDWSALAGSLDEGTDGPVWALASFDAGSGPMLYAGGDFTSAGSVLASNIAVWDGSEWAPVAGSSGAGANGPVVALAVYDDGTGAALYAGGWFDSAGGIYARYIARWDGSEWSALAGPFEAGTNGWVKALAVYDDGTGAALYAGGSFTEAGGEPVSYIARWDGSQWSALEGPFAAGTDGSVEALAVYDDGTGAALYAAGTFSSAGGLSTGRIARWDGTAWSALSGLDVSDGDIYSLAVHDDGTGDGLYAGGSFITAGGLTMNHIARRDQSGWAALGTAPAVGTNDEVLAMAVFNDGSGSRLFAGGSFITAGGRGSYYLAGWGCSLIFADGFESGDALAWDNVID